MTTQLVSAPVANADGDIELSPAAGREVFARINRPDFTRWATQVTGTGGLFASGAFGRLVDHGGYDHG
jgi:hypothetical protein